MHRISRRLAVSLLSCLASSAWAWSSPASVPFDALGRPLIGDGGQRLFYADGFGPPQREDASPHQTSTAATRAFDPGFLRDDATIGSFNQGLGVGGIHVFDADGDGALEILVGHTMMWYLLDHEPGRQDYVQRYFHETGRGSTFGGGGVVWVEPADIDGDGSIEVVVLREGGVVAAHAAATGVQTGYFDLGRQDPDRMSTADVLGDRADELLVLWPDEIRVFAFGNATPLWTMQTQGARDLAAGQMDTDPAMEVAVATGTGNPGMVFDAGSMSVQWSFSTGFGDRVASGDVDGDGLDEVIGAEAWRQVMVIDVDARLQKWAINNFNTSAIRARDADSDGIAEVLMGDAQWGDVHILDGLSGLELRAVRNPEHSVAAIDLADVDGDCDLEIVWGAGYSSSGSDRLYVADPITATIEWENIENDGPMHCFAIADLNGDGRTDVLRAGHESDAGYDGSLVFVSDLRHRRDIWIPSAPTNDGWMLTQGIGVANIDADSNLEYVMNDSRTYSGKVSAFDGVTHQRQWTSLIFDGEYISSVEAGDPDRDGQIDFLIGTGREHTGGQGAFLRVLRGSDGAMLWRSAALPSDWSGVGDIRVIDVDLDGVSEIVFLKLSNGLRVLDGVSHVEEWFLPGQWTALDVGQLDGIGTPEIVVGDANGSLVAFDGSTHAQRFQTSVGSGSVEAIRVADVDRDNSNEILLTLGRTSATGELQVRAADGQTLLWVSPPLVGAAGRGSSLYVADVDDDDQLEIAVSTSYALRFFEYAGVAETVPPVFPSTVGLNTAIQTVSADCCNVVELEWQEADDESSPPVEYRIYRSTTAGFTPGLANFLVQSGLTTHRDVRVSAGNTYYYVVRAVDRLGNEDGNRVERSVVVNGTPDPLPTDQGNVIRAFRAAGDVQLDFTGAPATTWRLYRDTSKTTIGRTSLPPDLVQTIFVDTGAISAARDYYYVLRGVSPCGNVGP